MSKIGHVALALVWLMSGVPVLAKDSQPPLEKVTLSLKWFHQFQFAGYYAAAAKGFYAEEGLEVSLLEPVNKRLPLETVMSGEAEYGVSAADLLKARMAGKPLVLLAVIFQHSPIVLVTRQDRNIRHPADLIGRTVMVGENDASEIKAMLLHEGVALNSIRFVPHSWALDDLALGRVDACQNYITDGPYQLRKRGVRAAVMKPINYGIDFYGDSLFTTEQELKQHPQRVAAFRRASIRGWEYAMSHVEEMVTLIMDLPGVRERGLTPDFLRSEAGQMELLIQPALVEIGHVNPGRWRRIADTYAELGLLDRNYSLAGFIYNPDAGADLSRVLRVLSGVLAATALLGISVAIWNRQLRRAVKKSTQDLRASSEYLQNVLDSSNDAVFVHDAASGRVLDVNRRMCEMYGCTREMALNSSLNAYSQGQAPYTETDAMDWLRKARETGPQTFVWWARRHDGRLFWAEVSVRFAVIGGAERFVVMVRDISDRKKAEEALIESAERFRILLDTAPMSIQGYLMDGTVAYWNEASERLYGYTAEEAIGKTLYDLIIPAEMRTAVQEAVRSMSESGQAIPPGEITLQRKDGSKVEVYSGHAVIKVPGRPAHLFCMDIDLSERKQSEQEREKLQSQLLQAQKMESVGRLAGGVAHDFNNMLGVIVGHTDLALEQVAPNQPIYEDLLEIRKAAQRSSDLTRQLLAYARKQTVVPKVLDLNETVEGMLKMLRRLLGEDLELIWRPGPPLWPLKMDPVQIDQILANLCVNARDAISKAGHITIQTGNVTLDKETCDHRAGFVPGEYVWLSVSDTGSGMTQEVMDHLFEPFFTTKGVGQGTGLGLATVYGIVKQNNGFIDVQSKPEQGATFTLYLPRYVGPLDRALEVPLILAGQANGQTILLVEDEPAILTLCQSFLGRLGYKILIASTPNEAIQLAHSHIGDIHLLITDVVMPEMNGWELAQRLVARHPKLKRLFMSGYTADVIAQHGVLEKGVHFIQKPFNNADLVANVQAVLNES